ncbi:hypothetical protein CTEN210_02322 [Chaetoceros tenuissimus]|uniref:methionine--tRNA ligase n=1 Tax=Chaetoceros tenuissimus TaxID=426638 RepID=A0AAD3CHC5_9STRA|nr:hypothetical protein CTEN210_02322 [Chaetoceros tenuissimus]
MFSTIDINKSTSDSTKTPVTSFDDGISPFQITTPIYYVNDKPHIGHAYTSLACDVIARFMRLSGREVFFMSGTDEHGQKVEESAKKRKMNPQDFVDEVSQSFRHLLTAMNISNDYFIRTTDDHHKKAVQHLWNTMVDNGYIYLGSYEGWYSVRDECYYLESELVDGKAPTGSEVIWQEKEPSYFFKLSAFEEKLMQYYDENPDFIAPDTRRNEVIGFVRQGLRDLSISRTSFSWGVPVPNDKDHVMYVWIDALANYISAIGYPDNMEAFEKLWPANLHIVGKDILRFHAVYWPAFLMAAGLPLPKRLFAHGWWTKDGEKISKSVGNVIDPLELTKTYGLDQTRFFLMSEVNFGNDGDFSHEKMITKVNNNLANELGNLCQRTLSLAYNNCGKSIPASIQALTEEDELLLSKARNLRSVCAEAIANQEIHKYVEALVTMIWDSNKYIDDQAPWFLRKTDIDRMATVLYVLMEVLRISSILYQPLIPESANKILDQLTVPENERSFEYIKSSPLAFGTRLQKPQIVFSRFEAENKQKKKSKKKKAKSTKQAAPIKSDVSSLDIRVGIIVKAWEHEEADKLFCEEIDIGEETGPRQIVSGLRSYYDLKDLVGQRVLVLANLKARKLMGFPSHGMVLCASNGEKTEFVEPPKDAAIGERVFVEGFDGEPATENQLARKKLLDIVFPELKTNVDGIATYKGSPLFTSAGSCRAQRGLANADVS